MAGLLAFMAAGAAEGAGKAFGEVAEETGKAKRQALRDKLNAEREHKFRSKELTQRFGHEKELEEIKAGRKPAPTRVIQKGDKSVTQEFDPVNRVWKDIAEGQKFRDPPDKGLTDNQLATLIVDRHTKVDQLGNKTLDKVAAQADFDAAGRSDLGVKVLGKRPVAVGTSAKNAGPLPKTEADLVVDRWYLVKDPANPEGPLIAKQWTERGFVFDDAVKPAPGKEKVERAASEAPALPRKPPFDPHERSRPGESAQFHEQARQREARRIKKEADQAEMSAKTDDDLKAMIQAEMGPEQRPGFSKGLLRKDRALIKKWSDLLGDPRRASRLVFGLLREE